MASTVDWCDKSTSMLPDSPPHSPSTSLASPPSFSPTSSQEHHDKAPNSPPETASSSRQSPSCELSQLPATDELGDEEVNTTYILEVNSLWSYYYGAMLIDMDVQVPQLLATTLDEPEAAYIAGAYADETRIILQAEAVIAERRYRQMLMATQSHKLAMLKAFKKYQRAVRHVNWFHDRTDDGATIPDSNPDWGAFPGLSGPTYPVDFLFSRRGNTDPCCQLTC